ncbi:MAG: phosphate ABC transporter ATP-binding protein [Candidatus Desulforudis sp.]|nr:phosphate ABC transporter ATP-binding protein [Desulforudis sp.]
MSEAVFALEGLAKTYGAREVLRVEELSFPAGLIHGLMGPSGAGKSTLLRLLNLLETPTAGRILYRGLDVGRYGSRLELRRRMAMVFQKPVLFDGTVFDNVAYGLKVRGLRNPVVREKVTDTLRAVGLEYLEKAQARTLSGGEAQRVALARALVIEPDVLLLDEPTSNLDPHNVALLEDLIRGTNGGRGSTVILVTHNVFQAERLTDRVVFMCDGRVVEEGPTAEVFTSPREERTRAFIRGDMVY